MLSPASRHTSGGREQHTSLEHGQRPRHLCVLVPPDTGISPSARQVRPSRGGVHEQEDSLDHVDAARPAICALPRGRGRADRRARLGPRRPAARRALPRPAARTAKSGSERWPVPAPPARLPPWMTRRQMGQDPELPRWSVSYFLTGRNAVRWTCVL
jgi:hypothetical protein